MSLADVFVWKMSEMVDDIDDDDDDEEERNMMVKMMSRTKVLEEREKEERDHGTSDALICSDCLRSGDDFFFLLGSLVWRRPQLNVYLVGLDPEMEFGLNFNLDSL